MAIAIALMWGVVVGSSMWPVHDRIPWRVRILAAIFVVAVACWTFTNPEIDTRAARVGAIAFLVIGVPGIVRQAVRWHQRSRSRQTTSGQRRVRVD